MAAAGVGRRVGGMTTATLVRLVLILTAGALALGILVALMALVQPVPVHVY